MPAVRTMFAIDTLCFTKYLYIVQNSTNEQRIFHSLIKTPFRRVLPKEDAELEIPLTNQTFTIIYVYFVQS